MGIVVNEFLEDPGLRTTGKECAEDLDFGMNLVNTYQLSLCGCFTPSIKSHNGGSILSQFKLPELDRGLLKFCHLSLTALDGDGPANSGSAELA